MSKRARRHISAEEKVRLLRLHLLEGKAVSDLCEEHGLQPAQFYQWQKVFFENGHRAFYTEREDPTKPLLRQVSELEKTLAQKDAVIAEVTQEFVTLKKTAGNHLRSNGSRMTSGIK